MSEWGAMAVGAAYSVLGLGRRRVRGSAESVKAQMRRLNRRRYTPEDALWQVDAFCCDRSGCEWCRPLTPKPNDSGYTVRPCGRVWQHQLDALTEKAAKQIAASPAWSKRGAIAKPMIGDTTDG